MCQPNCDFTGSEISTLRQLERHLGELRHHLVLGEIAEVAALRRRAGILRLFLGDGFEVGALLEVGRNLLGLILGRHQDVVRAHLFVAAHLLDRVVVDLLHRLIGTAALPSDLQDRFHQQLVADEGEAGFELLVSRPSSPRPPLPPA